MALFKKGEHLGKDHPLWKGNDVGYYALHDWVSRHRGSPKKCEHCGTTSKKRYEWANISKKYKRDLNDYIRLCKSCHMKFDGISPKHTKFKIGNVPKSKQMNFKDCLTCGKKMRVPACYWNIRKYCSRECRAIGMKGKPAWNKGRHIKSNDALSKYIKEHGPWNRGLTQENDPRLRYERPTKFKKKT